MARVGGLELLVLGDGPERARLERQARALGLSDRVRFLGAGTRDDVIRLFRGADVALLTSAWENLPHTLLEALAVGTPVIATAVGGIPEVVRDGENGLLVPAGDIDAIAPPSSGSPATTRYDARSRQPRRPRSRSSRSRVSCGGSCRRSMGDDA